MDKHLLQPTNKKWLSLLIMVGLLVASLSSTTIALSQAPGDTPLTTMVVSADRIEWPPQVKLESMLLTIAGPGDLMYHEEFPAGKTPVFVLSPGNPYLDGTYTYELRVVPILDEQTRAAIIAARETGQPGPVVPEQVQSGHFGIVNGSFVEPVEELAPEDQVIYDDLIVTSSACIGMDCNNGESFGFDTLRLKENNLRIHFQDTSSTGSFPTNDWRITINDSANGGASYFAIQDVDAGRNVFVVEAGAGNNALYVDDYGRVGLGTSTPAVELEVRESDTPTVRLNQDGSGGWSPQTWDMAGNEANFFIRDVTNGSQLPFRIKPGADSNALYINSNNNIGMGTSSPAWPLEIERNGSNPLIFLERVDTSAQFFFGVSTKGQLGTLSSHDVDLMAGGANRMTLLSSPEATTSADVIVPGTQHINGDLWVDGIIHGTVGSKQSSATIEELQAQVAELKARVAALESDNAALLGLLGELDKRLADLEAMSGEEPVRRLEQ